MEEEEGRAELERKVFDVIWKSAREAVEEKGASLATKLATMECIHHVQKDIKYIAPEAIGEAFRQWNILMACRDTKRYDMLDSGTRRKILEVVTKMENDLNELRALYSIK